MAEERRDQDGYVYEKNWAGNWVPKSELFTGQAQDRRDLRRPEPARDWLGRQEATDDGKLLYHTSDYQRGGGYSGGGGSGGGGGLEFLIAFLIVAAMVAVVGFIIAALVKLLEAVVNVYDDIAFRYPRAVLAVKLSLLTTGVGVLLSLSDFAPEVQLAGMLLVPGIWAWSWLTRTVPLIFMPLNAFLAGAALWVGSTLTEVYWASRWSELSAGLPLIGNLPLLLSVLPALVLILREGNRRWPQQAIPVNRLITGALLAFLLTRVWTAWQPYWDEWVDPVPLKLPAGWLLIVLPLAIWLWGQGRRRWPLPFDGFNLLLFGGFLGLLAYHTESRWIDVWRHWSSGLPLATTPILVIALSPLSAWTWSQLNRRWRRLFLVPNLLLAGALLWLVADRTRPLWVGSWNRIWGEVPFSFDLARAMLILPLLRRSWREGSQRWPQYWVHVRVITLTGGLWWIAERTRWLWQQRWHDFAGAEAPDLALVAGTSVPLLWLWAQLRDWRQREFSIVGVAVVSALLFWTVTRILPDAFLALPLAAASLPWVIWGWMSLLRRRVTVGVIVGLFPLALVALLFLVAPEFLNSLLFSFLRWLETQGLPLL